MFILKLVNAINNHREKTKEIFIMNMVTTAFSLFRLFLARTAKNSRYGPRWNHDVGELRAFRLSQKYYSCNERTHNTHNLTDLLTKDQTLTTTQNELFSGY